MTLRGEHIVLANFDATMVADCIDEEKLDYEDGKKDLDIKKHDKFSHIKWVAWEEMVHTYFTSMKDSQGVPLAYVIVKTPVPSGIVIDRRQEIIKMIPYRATCFPVTPRNSLRFSNS